MNIKYISWNYGKVRTNNGMQVVHLIRLSDGRGLLRTDDEMVALGLAKRD